MLALCTLVSLAVLASSVSYYVTRNTASAARSLAAQKARDLAEAGLNDATAALYEATDKLASNAVPAPASPVALAGGRYTYSAALAGSVWTLTGTGTQPAPGSTSLPAITRTVSRQVKIVQQPILDIWQYLYSDTTTGCMSVSNNATISAPLYVRGNLCVGNNAHITGSPLQVRQTLTLANNASVGYANAKVAEVRIGNGCNGRYGDPVHTCTAAGDNVNAVLLTTTVGELTKPKVDLVGWYANAAPGPRHPCANGSLAGSFDGNTVLDRSAAAFDLAPASAYDCRVYDANGAQIGRLSWTPGDPGTLVVDGVVFFDGDVFLNNNDHAVYTGRGTIYASGTVLIDNNSYLCGIAGCTSAWDTSANVLVFVAGAPTGYGLTLSNNSVYQGGAYLVADYDLVNNGVNWGPVIANQLAIANNAGQAIPLTTLPVGAPADVTTSLVPVADSYRG